MRPQPKNYLDYISTYKRSLTARRKENAEQTARLEGGLAKLIQAASEVGLLGWQAHAAPSPAQPSVHACCVHPGAAVAVLRPSSCSSCANAACGWRPQHLS